MKRNKGLLTQFLIAEAGGFEPPSSNIYTTIYHSIIYLFIIIIINIGV